MYRIITNNNYLRIALTSLLKCYVKDNPVCIIDISSCGSPGALITLLCEARITQKHKIILLSGKGIYSTMLPCLDVIDCSESAMAVLTCINDMKGHTADVTIKAIQFIQSLGMMNKMQKQICKRLNDGDIDFLAKEFNVSRQTIYRNMNDAAKKLNLKSIVH